VVAAAIAAAMEGPRKSLRMDMMVAFG